MFKSYVVIALRKLARERLYVAINIFSLALGIASFLLLGLYLRSELTYDHHHTNHDRIYRLTTHFVRTDGTNFAVAQDGLGPLLVKDYPQLGQQVRFRPSTQNVLTYGDVRRKWDRVYLTDPTVFEIFTHKILYGDVKGALDDPFSIAVSETFARYYFGSENPIGKTLSSGAFNYKVSLVFADLPENSHLKYDALLPMSLMDKFLPGFSSSYARTLWSVQTYTYVMVPEGFDAKSFAAISDGFNDHYMKENIAQLKTKYWTALQPLAEQHFGEKLEGDLPTGNIFYVYGFAAVALFTLLIACINYMNLATARAAKRAKEVGMRKVLGAGQHQLVAQFLGESFVLTAIAMIVAVVFVVLALAVTPIGSLMGKERLLAIGSDPVISGGIPLVFAIVALGSGLYPAFYLSSISPLAALTDVKRSWRAGFSMRQLLVLMQLIISIGVISCTLLMTDQMRYVQNKSLGFDKENRLIVTLRGYDVIKSLKTIKSELRNERGVVDVMTINQPPGTGHAVNLVPVETESGVIEPTGLDRIVVGLNFAQALNIKIVQGRAFSEDIATDAREAVMVNESFVKKMGWTTPIGKRFQSGANSFAHVIGVTQDFHYASLHNLVGPLMIQPMADQFENVPNNQKPLLTTSIIIVLSGEQLRSTLDRIQKVLVQFDPKLQFEPVFLDDTLNDLYRSESNLLKLTAAFAGICILISIVGLFGLAAFTTEQRTKELGIRMTLGASDSQIVSMLTRYVLPLVAIAAIPACFVSYYVINQWIQRFAYHSAVSWWTFVLSTLAVLIVTLATVATQSLLTTRSDPIKALRYE